MYLEKINSPADLRKLPPEALQVLSEEIRDVIIDTVSQNGGHLGANLGTVELILALHYVFDVPADSLIFDVGHQAYTHKIITGRKEFFRTLRQQDGCAGFPHPNESKFDSTVSGHAGTAISTALGIAIANIRSNKANKAIAIVGDGSLNCGISLEGLNHARDGRKNLIIILNDNKMSISRNVGGMARHLNRIISGGFYNRFKTGAKRLMFRLPRHKTLHKFIRRIEDLIKYLVLPGAIFEELGIRYIGPIDGHSLPDLLHHLNNIKSQQSGPILLHVITEKGHGYEHAKKNPAKYHGVPGFCKATGEIASSGKSTFSGAFGEAVCALAKSHPEVHAITAAMTDGTGLSEFSRLYWNRFHDVGIAEEHAVVFAAGLAAAGERPVCAIYATFMQRALDCIYHDVVLARLPVIFALDRAGAVEDGPTHHGIYDLGFLRALPGLTIIAPRSEAELKAMFDYAYTLARPVVIRYPRGGSATPIDAPVAAPEEGKAEIVREGSGPVIWAMGVETETALKVSELLNLDCCVISARFIAPFDAALAQKLAVNRVTISIEDHVLSGGLSSALDDALADCPHGRVLHFGWPSDRPIPHGKVSELRQKFGLTAQAIADQASANIANS
ncbi:MAG: 1-deoxy-D-xylulose-5-phosphate synthase [Victivallales bacterium]|jgi:1-deoxy-D-xylulose-5-phosphate synthase|nr:1-deoxy-D-xylulose-5-phosphate synthase [Victivallales bacterium]